MITGPMRVRDLNRRMRHLEGLRMLAQQMDVYRARNHKTPCEYTGDAPHTQAAHIQRWFVLAQHTTNPFFGGFATSDYGVRIA